ncbi:MAG: FAD-binding oxidoreductase [Pseudomonadota bacterium]
MRTADIIVIGAGMAGCGAAARMSAHANVVVLEAEERPAYHTTGRSAAVFILNYGNDVIRVFNAASEETFRTGADLSENGFLSPRGVLEVEEPGQSEAFEDFIAGSNGLQILNVQETLELFPICRPEMVVRSAYEPDASDIDVDALLQSFIRILRANGSQIVPNARVSALQRTGDIWRAETPTGSFEAPIVVNAAGAWGDVVARLAGIEPVGLTPCRRTIAVVPVPDDMDATRWPVTASIGETWYAKPDGGRLWVSPADEDPVEPHDAYPDDMIMAEGLHRFSEATTFEVKRVENSWAGLRTFAPDRTLVNGWEPDADGFFWLVGQGGYGIQTAPAMSQLAADLVLDHAPVVAQDTIQAVSPARFR